MTLERELKFDVPPGVGLDVAGLASGELRAEATPPRTLDATYYDTPDLTLARWGVTLRCRSDEGWLLKLPDAGPAPDPGMMSRLEIGFDAEPGTEPPVAARRMISGFTRHAPVAAVARVITVRTPWIIRRGDDQIAELTDDVVTASSPGGTAAATVPQRQVEVELRGEADAGAVAGLAEALVRAGALASRRGKLTMALGAGVDRPPDVVIPALGDPPTARELVHAAIARSVRQLLVELPGVHLGEDPEAVHQARVATRRLRSDLRTFEPLCDPAWTERLRTEMATLGGALGRVRDLDVLIGIVAAAAAEEPTIDAAGAGGVVAWFEEQRTAARADLIATLVDPATLTVLDHLVDSSADPRTAPQADDPVGPELAGLVRRRWRKVRSLARSLGDHPADEQLHALRLRTKRARYAAEAVAPAYGAPAAKAAKRLAALQGSLGDLNDAVVITARLREAAIERPDLGFACGQLAAAMARQAQQSREHWRQDWAALTTGEHHRWLEGR